MKSREEILERLREHQREMFIVDTPNMDQFCYEDYLVLSSKIAELEWVLNKQK